MRFIDLFAGIGGFRLGMEQAGHECVAFCEIDKFARKSYKAIHDTDGERPVMEVVWENIEKYRIEKKISIAKLCKNAGYQSSSYHKNKKSKAQMLPNTIQKFAGVLGVKTIDLYEDWSEPQ